VALGQRIAKSDGRPSAKRLRRGVRVANVSWPGSQAGAANASPSELRGLTRYFSDRKALNGPAMRPQTPLAVENGVGKLAAPQRVRLMSARERESGDLPAPNLPPFGRKAGRGLFVFLPNKGTGGGQKVFFQFGDYAGWQPKAALSRTHSTHFFFSKCPPKPKRMAESSLSW
jgi:hypothetical protein